MSTEVPQVSVTLRMNTRSTGWLAGTVTLGGTRPAAVISITRVATGSADADGVVCGRDRRRPAETFALGA